MKNAIGILAIDHPSVTEQQMSCLQVCSIYGIEAYLIPVMNVPTGNQEPIVEAFIWKDGKLEKTITEFPYFVEFYFPYASIKKHCPQQYQWLEAHVRFTDYLGMNKVSFQNLLTASSLYPHAIPTVVVSTYEEIVKYMSAIPKAILKPLEGTRGVGIMRLNKESSGITYASYLGSGSFTEESFQAYCNGEVKELNGPLLLEPYINIKDDAGRAIDFRCLVSLNGQGKWQNVLTYARIGASDVSSNFSHGGSLNYADEELAELIPGQAKEKLAEMNQIVLEAAELICKDKVHHPSILGFDVCLERETGKLYIIEANSKPGVKLVGPWPLSLARAQYFRYLLEHQQ